MKVRATRRYRKHCGYAFLAAKPRGWAPAKVVIDVEYRCSKAAEGYVARDIQNAISALKSGVDALADVGVIPNDSKEWLRWGVFNLVTTMNPKGDGVTVIVRAQ